MSNEKEAQNNSEVKKKTIEMEIIQQNEKTDEEDINKFDDET